jgi:hypothetical protein
MKRALPQNVIDLRGKVFGKLTVLSFAGVRKNTGAHWLCRCSCSSQIEKIIDGQSLKRGKTKTCGNCPNRFEDVPGTGVTIIWIDQRNGDSFPCLIDTKNYHLVKDHRWRIRLPRQKHLTPYVQAGDSTPIHRLLIPGLKFSQEGDHINGDGLDNRERNLRPSTSTQNKHNTRKQHRKTGTTYKGVTFKRKNFQARIVVNGRQIVLGTFKIPEHAARAYNEAATKYFGEFAYLNDLGDVSDVLIGGVYANGPLRGQKANKSK